jgi:hypothetical protein
VDAAAAKDINIAGGQVALVSKDDAASAISLTTNIGTSETIVVTNTQGTGTGAITLAATAGGVDIDAAATLDVNIAGGQVAISSKDNAASAISLTVNQGTSETIVVTNTQGTDEAAIAITSTAGGVDINAAAGKNVTVDGGQVLLTSSDSAADAIYLHSDGGTAETIRIHSDQSTQVSDTAASIQLTSDVGAITLNSTVDNPAGIKLLGNTGAGIQLRAGTSSEGTDVEGGRRFIVSRQSTDATPASYTFSLASDKVGHFNVVLIGRNATTTSESFQITVNGTATNISGTMAILGVTNTITTRGTTTATANVSVTEAVPDTIDLDMTGVDAETINWRGYIEFVTDDDTLSRTA